MARMQNRVLTAFVRIILKKREDFNKMQEKKTFRTSTNMEFKLIPTIRDGIPCLYNGAKTWKIILQYFSVRLEYCLHVNYLNVFF